MPLVWDGTIDDLPESIADILRRATADREAGRSVTTLCALAAMIDPRYRGQSMSPAAVRAMIDLARAQQLMTLVSVDAEIGIAGAPTVRIDTSGSALPPDPRFAELEARAAAEQQAEAEAAAADAHAQATERAK